MQGQGRPHFMGHRGGFQGMPHPGDHPASRHLGPPCCMGVWQCCGNLVDATVLFLSLYLQEEVAGQGRIPEWEDFPSMESIQKAPPSHLIQRKVGAYPCQTCHRCVLPPPPRDE